MTPEERRAKECAQHRERYYWYKAHGICVSCGQADAAPGKVKCEECAAKVADRSMAAYYRKREERKEAMRRRQRESGMQSAGQRGSVLIAAKNVCRKTALSGLFSATTPL